MTDPDGSARGSYTPVEGTLVIWKRQREAAFTWIQMDVHISSDFRNGEPLETPLRFSADFTLHTADAIKGATTAELLMRFLQDIDENAHGLKQEIFHGQ